MEQGIGYSEALEEAQAKGIAERDPSLDVEGLDTAVKLLLIANAVMGLDLSLKNIKVQGITHIPSQVLEAAKKEGKALKLLGRIQRTKEDFRAEVSLSAVSRSHPLHGVDGTNKGLTYFTDSMGAVTVTGGKSDPRGAAAALLKDIINIYC
jgi:homoserine dehydrogenase